MRFNLHLSIIMLIFVFVGACSKTPEKKPPPPPMKVGAVSAQPGDIQQTLEFSGSLTFIGNTTVSSEVSAQIKSIEASDGQRIEQGQLLLVFDDTKIKESANQALANLQKDEATLSFNKIEWEKNHELFKSHSISQTQYEQKLSIYQNSVAQVEAGKAALAKANQDLLKTRVLAPIPGLLSNRYVERGDWVAEGSKLFQISDYSRIYLEAFLTDIDVGKLNVQSIINQGIDGEVTVDSYPGKAFKGKLSYIQPVANQGRLFQVRIYLDNPDLLLLQGMFARGRIVVKTIPNVLRVPLNALLEQIRENHANNVFTVDANNKAELTKIKIGHTDPQWAEVTEGLKPGNTVVVQGKEILSTGQPVEITKQEKTAALISKEQ